MQSVDPEIYAALPDQYDEATFGPVLKQITMQTGGATGVQSTYVNGQGQRVAILRDGSTRVLGDNDQGMANQTVSITGPDGKDRQFTFKCCRPATMSRLAAVNLRLSRLPRLIPLA